MVEVAVFCVGLLVGGLVTGWLDRRMLDQAEDALRQSQMMLRQAQDMSLETTELLHGDL